MGRRGELLAAGSLFLRGHSILARNLHTPYAEIDILARQGRDLIVVEVKARRRSPTDMPVGFGQQDRLRRAATWAYGEWGDPDGGVRIDVVVVDFSRARWWRPWPVIEHRRGAVEG